MLLVPLVFTGWVREPPGGSRPTRANAGLPPHSRERDWGPGLEWGTRHPICSTWNTNEPVTWGQPRGSIECGPRLGFAGPLKPTQGLNGAPGTRRLSGTVSPTESQIVVDGTALTGRHHLELRWNPAELSARPAESGADAGSGSAELTTAIREQPGLVLVLTHGLLDTVVIDHIEWSRKTSRNETGSVPRGTHPLKPKEGLNGPPVPLNKA